MKEEGKDEQEEWREGGRRERGERKGDKERRGERERH